MRRIIKGIYRFITPKGIKNYLAIFTDDQKWQQLRKEILDYYKGIPNGEIDSEKRSLVSFLKRNYLGVFLYPWRYNYDWQKVKVYFAKGIDLKYVLFRGNRLFFKRVWSDEKIKKAYYFLQMEQDPSSPHKYLTKDFIVGQNDVVADIGVAEGNFALEIIDSVSKVYLFEADPEWIEPLKATFKPWGNKVEIINKFVSDIDDKANVSLDNYFQNKDQPNFLKIDAEGSETNILKGANRIIESESSLKIGLCTYHRQEDAEVFSGLLKKRTCSFEISFSQGYMLFMYDPNIAPPYFRRGLIRAIRKTDWNNLNG